MNTTTQRWLWVTLIVAITLGFTWQFYPLTDAKERLDQTASVLKKRKTEEWLELLDAEQVPCAPILPLSEVIDHPQILANDLIFESDHPVVGRIRQARAAARFDKTQTTLDGPAPTLGQHTDEIMKELGIE